MVDARFSSHVQENVGNPHAALCYGISLLYCVPAALRPWDWPRISGDTVLPRPVLSHSAPGRNLPRPP
jgi:hypothetical protein